MRETSGSVFLAILFNPLVWIGWILTGFTLHYNGAYRAFDVLFEPETYRNLAIGSAIYVGLFARQYHPGRVKLDLAETTMKVFETMATILLVWLVSMGIIVNYHISGQNYSQSIALRYQQNGGESDDRSFVEHRESFDMPNMEVGKKYKYTPNEDGSFIIEVLED